MLEEKQCGAGFLKREIINGIKVFSYTEETGSYYSSPTVSTTYYTRSNGIFDFTREEIVEV